jgi:hypothetical protein
MSRGKIFYENFGRFKGRTAGSGAWAFVMKSSASSRLLYTANAGVVFLGEPVNFLVGAFHDGKTALFEKHQKAHIPFSWTA